MNGLTPEFDNKLLIKFGDCPVKAGRTSPPSWPHRKAGRTTPQRMGRRLCQRLAGVDNNQSAYAGLAYFP
jgi:hypothetical protein